MIIIKRIFKILLFPIHVVLFLEVINDRLIRIERSLELIDSKLNVESDKFSIKIENLSQSIFKQKNTLVSDEFISFFEMRRNSRND